MPTPAAPSPATPLETDALVIGAGAAGLWQAFQLGLLGVSCHTVDALSHPGGQCAQLYPDKPLYDIPGIPHCSGQELVERLLVQLRPMQPQSHWGKRIDQVQRTEDGRWEVRAHDGTAWRARCVFLTSGIGAFVPRALPLPALDAFDGTQLHYHADKSWLESTDTLAGQAVVVMGGDAAAVEAALRLSRRRDAQAPARVTLLHRRAVLQGEERLLQDWHQACEAQAATFQVGQPVAAQTDAQGRLTQLTLSTPEGTEVALNADVLLAYPGLSPKLAPFADWGLPLQRKQLPVDPATLGTAQPGIYAAGDIVDYPGKRKLLLCAFHEATQAAYAAVEYLQGEAPPLLYTTTSPRLHQRLGVSHD